MRLAVLAIYLVAHVIAVPEVCFEAYSMTFCCTALVYVGVLFNLQENQPAVLPALPTSASVSHMRTLVETMLVDVGLRVQQGNDQSADAIADVRALMSELTNTAATIQERMLSHDVNDKRLRSMLQQLAKEKGEGSTLLFFNFI
jgi:hypothetical protein